MLDILHMHMYLLLRDGKFLQNFCIQKVSGDQFVYVFNVYMAEV